MARPGFAWKSVDLAGRGLYLSDLHAGRDPQADQDTRAMLRQLASCERAYDWICWGGDTFDFLAAGNTAALARVYWIIETMQLLAARGVHQYIIEGNHDFHLGFLAIHIPQLVVVPDGLCDAGRGLALVHGDWHTAGGLYGPMRHLFRSSLMFRMLAYGPHSLVDRVAAAWSRGSHTMRGGAPEPDYLVFVARRFRAAMAGEPGLRIWLSGHIHWPSVVRQPGAACYINGEWAVHRTAIEIDATGAVGYLHWAAGRWAAYTPALAEL